MLWGILIVIGIMIAAVLLKEIFDSTFGKVVLIAAVVGIALLIISWITGFGFLVTLAKVCAVIIVITIVVVIILAIIGSLL